MSRKENQEKKEYLSSYKVYLRRIAAKELELEKLEIDKRTAAATKYSQMPKGSGGNSDLSDYIVAIERLEQEIMREKIKYMNKKDEIMAAVNTMEHPELSEVLELRYMYGMEWKEVSRRLHYGQTKIFEMHGDALNEFKIPGEQNGK